MCDSDGTRKCKGENGACPDGNNCSCDGSPKTTLVAGPITGSSLRELEVRQWDRTPCLHRTGVVAELPSEESSNQDNTVIPDHKQGYSGIGGPIFPPERSEK